MPNPLLITDLVLRDASQSLLATRVRIEDMLPIAAKLDQQPSLEITLGVPQEADVILVGHARGNPIEAGRWARAIEVEVYVNGERHRLRMHIDERRKGRLVLPKPVRVRELRLVVPFAAPGANGETSVGFAEVELQLRRGQ